MQRVQPPTALRLSCTGMLLDTDGVGRRALPRLAERVRQTTKNRRTQQCAPPLLVVVAPMSWGPRMQPRCPLSTIVRHCQDEGTGLDKVTRSLTSDGQAGLHRSATPRRVVSALRAASPSTAACGRKN